MTGEEIAALVAKTIGERMEALKADNKSANAGMIKEMLDAALVANKAQETEKVEKGVRLGRMIRAFAKKNGNLREAAQYAEETFHDQHVAKALGTSPGDAGGFLVPVEYSNELIELLRPRSVVRSLGPNVIPMETGTLKIPRLAGGATATYTGESVAQNASQESTEQLNLVWKKLTATVPVSNELLRFSSPSADMMVRDDLVLSMATAEDKAFIRADGTANQVKGLKSWVPSANTTTSAGTTLANVDTDLKTLIGYLRSANVRMIRPAFIMSNRSATMFNFLRTSLGPLAYPSMAGENPSLMTYRVGVTNNIPDNISSSYSEVYFLDMADVVIGEASQFELQVSNEAAYVDSTGTLVSAFSRDETVIKAVARHDLVMRHDKSVAYLSNIAWS